MDQTLDMLLFGYAWLPALRRRKGADTVRLRLAGRTAFAVSGPGAAQLFADDRDVVRDGVPAVARRATLGGLGGVQGLDGEAHRRRKQLFFRSLRETRVAALVDAAEEGWQRRLRHWRPAHPVSLHGEAAEALTEAACDWAAVPLAPGTARDLVAMIDGAAAAGSRHRRARRARHRREAQLAGLVAEVRAQVVRPPRDSALAEVAAHRDAAGVPLDPRTAAVELLNLLRSVAAVSWLVMFAGHALHRWPVHRERLADPRYATAFVHELRRFYPLVPFLAGRARRELHWHGRRIPTGSLILLDVYGQHHDPAVFASPYHFEPARFLHRAPGEYDLLAQGAGDQWTGHRCPGESATVRLAAALVARLAAASYAVPAQDLRISLSRVPARVPHGLTLAPVPSRVRA